MSLSPTTVTNYLMSRTHERLLAVIDGVDDAALFHAESKTVPSVAFHLWHIARWADILQSSLAAMTDEMRNRLGERPQIWDADKLAVAWKLPVGQLGGNDSGMGIDEELSVTMPLPARDVLLDYVRRAFEAANSACAAVDDAQLEASGRDLYGRDSSVGSAMLSHYGHANRHLGSIEALKGFSGTKGSATV